MKSQGPFRLFTLIWKVIVSERSNHADILIHLEMQYVHITPAFYSGYSNNLCSQIICSDEMDEDTGKSVL